MNHYEPDSLRCTALGVDKKRCTRKGTHDNGSGVLCEYHHGKYLVKKANDIPVKKNGTR